MDRRDAPDPADEDRAESRRRPVSQPPWVTAVAIGIIAVVVMATVAGALLS